MVSLLLPAAFCPRLGTSRRFASASTSRASRAAARDFPARCRCGLLPPASPTRSDNAVESPDVLSRRWLLLASTLGVAVQLTTTGPANAQRPSLVFVAGATGQTGRRVVTQLRSLGINVRAGARDAAKAQSLGFGNDKGIEIVLADVTGSSDDLVRAIGAADSVVCATGFAPSFNMGKDNPEAVDNRGTQNLVDAAKRAGVKKFILVSSLLVNGAAMGQAENPNYKVLNLFGGVLDQKLAGEKYLRASGLDWTIVRPGGLSSDPPEDVGGPVVLSREDTLFGLDTDPGREISRDLVAELCVQALLQPAAAKKLVEAVQSKEKNPAKAMSRDEWFAFIDGS